MKQSNYKKPPVAAVKPHKMELHGVTRTDNYFWLKDKENTEVTEYLNAENAYKDEIMKDTVDLQEQLYSEMVGRIKEDDESYPHLDNGYYYYSRTEKGSQYQIICRRKGSIDAPEEVIFDINKMAEGKSAYIFINFNISPDNRYAIFLANDTGSYAEFTMRIKDLETGDILPLSVDRVASTAWAKDSKTILYTKSDDALRPCMAYMLKINQPESEAELLYEEKDDRFRLYVYTDKTGDYILMPSSSYTTSEVRVFNADSPETGSVVFMPRVPDVDYGLIPHKDRFYIRYKDKENLNSKIYSAPLAAPTEREKWTEVIAHSDLEKIESVMITHDYLVVEKRRDGLGKIDILNIKSGEMSGIDFPEPVYSVWLTANAEYYADKVRYGYMSLNRPMSVFDYDIKTGKAEMLKQQEIPSGFDPDGYTVERLFAKATDGTEVPISLVYKKGLKKGPDTPALLYSYGSYGISTDPDFNSKIYSLVDRGFIYALAHIRGGSDMGEKWYEDGKKLRKKNTFTDFNTCAEHLINEGYTSPRRLAIMGGSAGGLLMGAVLNLRPDLYNASLLKVPFVDVVTTMLDTSLPLTTGEYEEWGNPNEKEYFDYMLSYSPYDNIEAKTYPHMLVSGGINDSQVLFHEPAKYTAKMREMKTGDKLLIMDMNMESGHGGATGRYSKLRDTALDYAFILMTTGD